MTRTTPFTLADTIPEVVVFPLELLIPVDIVDRDGHQPCTALLLDCYPFLFPLFRLSSIIKLPRPNLPR